MLNHSFAISELSRKLANIIRVGSVKEIDYKKARVRIKVEEFLTDWLPWIAYRAGEDKAWSPPSIDEQVIVLSLGGELALGVVLPAIYQQKYPPPECQKTANILEFRDGTKLSYDSDKNRLEIDVVEK